MYGYTNEAGEPIMDGAAYRFEQQLDAEYAEQRYLDDDEFFGGDEDDFYGDPDGCVAAGVHGTASDCDNEGVWTCTYCGEQVAEPDDSLYMMEDQHLDGTWEE